MRRSFFDRVACDEPAWLVARREPAQHAPRIVWSLAWPSGMACRAGAGRHGCDGALSTTSAMTAGSLIASPAAGSRGALRQPAHYTLNSIFWLAALTAATSEAGAGCLTSPVLSKPVRGVSARHPRRPRRARVACRSSGVPSRLCRVVCLTQSAAARGRRRRCAANAAAVCVTIASPLCPRCVVDAARRSPLPCPSLPRIINCLRDKSSPNYSSPEVARPHLFINWSRLFTRRSFTGDKSSPN